jgi:hypothetical protein
MGKCVCLCAALGISNMSMVSYTNFCRQFPFTGLPGYRYGSDNTVTLNLTQSGICVHTLHVFITYGDLLLKRHVPETSNSLGAMFMPLTTTSRSVVDFDDPLPAGTLLISMDMRWAFGSMCGLFEDTINLSAYLQTHPLGLMEGSQEFLCIETCQVSSFEMSYFRGMDIRSRDRCPIDQPYCTRWTFPNSTRYQTGWPDYKYGQSNHLAFNYDHDSNDDGRYNVDAFYLVMLYYTPDAKKVIPGW